MELGKSVRHLIGKSISIDHSGSLHNSIFYIARNKYNHFYFRISDKFFLTRHPSLHIALSVENNIKDYEIR